MKITLLSIFLLAACCLPAQDRNQTVGQPVKRLALVIGNSNYTYQNPLSNPVNDAADMTAALRDLGFEVLKYTDLDKRAMRNAIDAFGTKLFQGYSVALVFYAGHGLQVKGENYLVPIEANSAQEADVEFDCISSDLLLAKMEQANIPTKIVLLDACRNNPFARAFATRGNVTNGLAGMTAPEGTFIGFAASPGKTAADGKGRNGTYTAAVLQHIKNCNMNIDDIFTDVTKTVKNVTQQADPTKVQTPFKNSSLEDRFYFKICENEAAPAPVITPSKPVPPPSKPAPTATFDIPVPNMIYVEGNGSVESFYIGETEITTGQYLAFCNATKSHYPEWLEAGSTYNIKTGTDGHYKDRGISESAVSLPITGVSWNDAVAYCEWLKQKTGQNYKLPTEAQWEYAAKGGSSASSLTAKYEYAGSSDINAVAWYSENAGGKPHNVKGKQKNELGLYDMSGNVWEWCEDLSGSNRVFRGGSWFNNAAICRVAFRDGFSPDYRNRNLGFRLSRTY